MSKTDERNATVELEAELMSGPLINSIFDHWHAPDPDECASAWAAAETTLLSTGYRVLEEMRSPKARDADGNLNQPLPRSVSAG